MKKMVLFIAMFLTLALRAQAEIKSEVIEYKEGDTVLEGYLVYDDAVKGKRPGVVVVHNWLGFGGSANQRTEQLAQLGYVALAIDIYGKGVRPKNTDEAAAQATIYKSDRALMRKRAWAGLDALMNHPLVDKDRLAAMGYCFGGTVSLELARSGAPLAGVVSFHGGLSASNSEDAKNIKAKILILHGADDPFVSEAEVQAFRKEMTGANVDWQLVYYSGAVHSFTEKAAGTDNAKGAAYNASADKRSWEAMKQFFKEIF